MNKTIYQKKVDLRKRSTMIDFLKNHTRYYMMNSWNRIQSFAHCVKYHTLQMPELTSEQEEVAWALLEDKFDCEAWRSSYEALCEEFAAETGGYHVSFNGRSDGWLVLYPPDNKSYLEEIADFEDKTNEELREWVKLVQRFDKFCDDIRQAFIYAITHYKIKTRKIIIETTETYIVDPEYDDFDDNESEE